MMNQADREEIRRRARARLAAERAGTEMVTMTVPATDVVAGDWLVEIGGSFGIVGNDKPRRWKAEKVDGGGARVVKVEDVQHGPGVWLHLADDGYAVTFDAPCVVRRRVPVDDFIRLPDGALR